MYLLMECRIHSSWAQRQRSEVFERGVFGEGEEVGFGTAFGAGPVLGQEGGGGRGAFAGDVDEV
jgi:hypothetical protein